MAIDPDQFEPGTDAWMRAVAAMPMRETSDEAPTPERIERALRVLAYLEAVEDYEPLSASEWLECADGLPRPNPD